MLRSRRRQVGWGLLALVLTGTGWRAHAATDLQDDPLAIRAKGSPSAPVTVFEMSDFQCPYCRRHALETFPIIEREYLATGKVRWVFINFPLVDLHRNALPAAEVAMCAARQKAFWPIHDLLYATQPDWSGLDDPGPFFMELADSAKVNRVQLRTCLEGEETLPQIRADAEGSSRAGATRTPTFYIEGGLLVGAHPIAVFRTVLDSIYQAKTSGGDGRQRR